MYKKDQSKKILVFSLITYGLGVFGLDMALQPFSEIVDEVSNLEDGVVNEKWENATASLDIIEKEWQKYEVLVRVMNQQRISDEFELRLDECRFLVEDQNQLAILQVATIKDDLIRMTSAVQTP